MRGGDGSWTSSSRISLTSPGGKERGARRAAADIAIAVLLGLYACREDTDEDMLLVRMGLPGAADDLARTVYKKVKSLHLSLPSLADECPEWAWYEES
jgi:hypothetical protein